MRVYVYVCVCNLIFSIFLRFKEPFIKNFSTLVGEKMNLSASQCSSGCESGWTLYLDQSFPSKHEYSFGGTYVGDEYAGKGSRVLEDVEGGEEDLSMVSDASSGPRHYCEDDEDCFDENGCYFSPPSASELAQKRKKKQKIKDHYGRNLQHPYLDDTASSPVLSLSKKNTTFSKNEASMEHVLDFSQGSSATHLKGKAKLKRHFHFLKSSLANTTASGETGGLQGRKWENAPGQL